VQILVELLEDEVKLAKESDAYQRTSIVSEDNTSRNPSFTSNRTISTCASSVSESSYTTACDEAGVIVTRTAGMVKKAKKETVQPTPSKKREAAQPPQTVRVANMRVFIAG